MGQTTSSIVGRGRGNAQFAESHHQQSLSRLLRLPNELLLMVLEYMPPAAIACFALTCKRFYSLAIPLASGRFHPVFDRSNRIELLLLLEKDDTARFYCHYCIQLHVFDKNWNPKTTVSWQRRPCYNRSVFLIGGSIRGPNLQLSHHDVRLIMNRHLHGPTHGLPLEALAVSYRNSKSFWGEPGWRETWTPRIIQDELYLRGKFTVSYPSHDYAREQVDFPRKFCKHVYYPYSKFPGHTNPSKTLVGLDKKEIYSYCGSCTYCLMDWEMAIEWEPRDDGCTVTTTIYYQLGSCRSPLEWKWNYFVGDRPPYESTQTRRSHGEANGAVKERWENGGDEQTDVVAKTTSPVVETLADTGEILLATTLHALFPDTLFSTRVI